MKNLFKLLIVAVVFISLGQINDLQAQKIGHVNSSVILSDMPEVMAADAELETLQKQLVAQAQRKVEALQADYQSLIRKEQQGELSPKQLQEEQMRLREKEQELNMEDQNIQNTLMKKRNTLLNPILERVQRAIEDVAEENNLEYVLDTSGGSVLFAQEENDIGHLVKQKLGIN
nr:OmpH family outer membrane protein [Saprospiraceae bacterium]